MSPERPRNEPPSLANLPGFRFRSVGVALARSGEKWQEVAGIFSRLSARRLFVFGVVLMLPECYRKVQVPFLSFFMFFSGFLPEHWPEPSPEPSLSD